MCKETGNIRVLYENVCEEMCNKVDVGPAASIRVAIHGAVNAAKNVTIDNKFNQIMRFK